MVPIYVAVITAAAAIAGAAIPQFTILRDRRERNATAVRNACLDLLRSVGEMRAQVANSYEYRGTGIDARLADTRKYAAAIELRALNVVLLAPGQFAEPAELLAAAVRNLAKATADNTDLTLGTMIRSPDFDELDECVLAFRRIAVTDAQHRSNDGLPGSGPVGVQSRDAGMAVRGRWHGRLVLPDLRRRSRR